MPEPQPIDQFEVLKWVFNIYPEFDDRNARHLFMDLLAVVDRNGTISMCVPALARRFNMPVDEVSNNLKILELGPSNILEKSNQTDEFCWRIKIWDRMVRRYKDIKRRRFGRSRMARFRENGGGRYGGWSFIRAKILKRDNMTCRYCGDVANTVDHVIPKTRGGSDSESNLVAACLRCNCSKNNRTPEESGMTLK